MVRLARIGASIALLSVCLGAQHAEGAELTPERRAAIVTLFEEAGRLMTEGRVPEACGKLEAARRLDPAALGVLLRLGACYEADEKLASARAQYLEAVAVARRLRDPRESVAAEHAAALASRLSYLSIVVAEKLDPATVSIVVDGTELLPAEWGVPMAVNRGTRVVAATVAGKPVWTTTVEVSAEPARLELALPPLASKVRAVLEENARANEATPEADNPTRARARRAGDPLAGPQRLAGWVLGAAGLAALGVGLGFGSRSLAAASESGDHCDDDDFCDEQGLALRRDAIEARTLGLAIGIPGAALVGLGIALVVTAPATSDGDADASVVRLELGPGRLSVAGRW